MSENAVMQPVLSSIVWKESENSKWLRRAVLAVLGTALLTLSAKISVPFFPVPQTMQSFVVLGLGMALGSRLGAATVALYLFEGAMGLPVFAGGGGFAYMMGGTGGYLVGFVIAAYLTGFLAERGWDRNAYTTAAAMFLGTLAIYAPGLAWLTSLIGAEKAMTYGLLPFVYGDIAKLGLAALLMPTVWKFIKR